MANRFLNDSERERLDNFPIEVFQKDIVTFFTISDTDMEQIPVKTTECNRLGFSLQLCALRYLGFSPDVRKAPSNVIGHVANQLSIHSDELVFYGIRSQTVSDHLLKIQGYLGYRKPDILILSNLSEWLAERAMEHDKPILLFQLACEKLKNMKIIRPGLTVLEELVLVARQNANKSTYSLLSHIITGDSKIFLDGLLLVDEEKAQTYLYWIRQQPISNTPKSILASLEKLEYLKSNNVDGWNINNIHPNRIKLLAGVGRRSSNQALQRMPEIRRYPILIAFLYQSYIDITDEIIDMYDNCMNDTFKRASRDLENFKRSISKTANEKLKLLRVVGKTVLDSSIQDMELRSEIYNRIPKVDLELALEECEEIIRPDDDSYYDFLENRYNYLRQFTPAFLNQTEFLSNRQDDSLIEATRVINELNENNRRRVPDDAPTDFVPNRWQPYIYDQNGNINRRFYELSVLDELRGALRAGNIFINNSRRYANPDSYLIQKEEWGKYREEVSQQTGVPVNGKLRIDEKIEDLNTLLDQFDRFIRNNDEIRIENEKLVISPLEKIDKPDSLIELESQIDKRIPEVDLSDQMIETDSWTTFNKHFVHAGGGEPRSKDFLVHLYASLMTHSSNMYLSKMAQSSGLSYEKLAWCSDWYLRDETLKDAITELVNYQYHLPLAKYWGGGTMSSSDGQRFTASGKVRNAVYLSKYFGPGKGVTFYTWTADQYSQFGSKVITSTLRDAGYVLDEILNNETELNILEHTTDTSGYTLLIFALFDLLGMRFSPRLRDIADLTLFKADTNRTYRNIESLLTGKINVNLILDNWDDLLRIAGSFKLGYVSASLYISKLQAYPRKNTLTLALQEYGKLNRTIFILRYLMDKDYRRRILIQLNKGEELHQLRQFLMFANEGLIRKKRLDEQSNQAACLTLMTNIVISWNTAYIWEIIQQLIREGHTIRDEDIAHVSPARFSHINPFGRYYFDVEGELNRQGFRTLRTP